MSFHAAEAIYICENVDKHAIYRGSDIHEVAKITLQKWHVHNDRLPMQFSVSLQQIISMHICKAADVLRQPKGKF